MVAEGFADFGLLDAPWPVVAAGEFPPPPAPAPAPPPAPPLVRLAHEARRLGPAGFNRFWRDSYLPHPQSSIEFALAADVVRSGSTCEAQRELPWVRASCTRLTRRRSWDSDEARFSGSSAYCCRSSSCPLYFADTANLRDVEPLAPSRARSA